MIFDAYVSLPEGNTRQILPLSQLWSSDTSGTWALSLSRRFKRSSFSLYSRSVSVSKVSAFHGRVHMVHICAWWESPCLVGTSLVFHLMINPLWNTLVSWVPANIGGNLDQKHPTLQSNKTMENHHVWWENSLFLWPWSQQLCNKLAEGIYSESSACTSEWIHHFDFVNQSSHHWIWVNYNISLTWIVRP